MPQADVSPPALLVEHRAHALWITLNRPQSLNALTSEIMMRISALLAEARANPQIKALVLTGTGRAFCAGTDLREVGQAADINPTAAFMAVAEPATQAIRSFPKPTIAAVNGLALAGGLEVALCCDFIVAADTARFGDAHANVGLIPGGGSTVRLPRRIGHALAKYLIFSGEMMTAQVMQNAGLVLEVCPAEALQDRVDALVAKFADKSPLAIARAKQLIDTAEQYPEEEALGREAAMAIEHSTSLDAREGLAAFQAKRKPVFVGR